MNFPPAANTSVRPSGHLPILVRAAGGLIGAMLFTLAVISVHHLLGELNYATLRAAVTELSGTQLTLAALCTMLSFVLLTGYDVSALRYLGKALPLPLVAFTSFCAYAVGNTVGVSFLSGGSIRYRLYLAAGLDGADVVRITAFNLLAFGIGVNAVGTLALMLHPEPMARLLGIGPQALSVASAAACLVLLAFVILCVAHRRSLVVGPWRVRLPSGKLVAIQLLISALDIAVSGLCLFVLLPSHQVPFLAFLAVYAAATVAGVLSHVPGGIGVFESIMLLAFKDEIAVDGLTAALVAYRLVYYLGPLLGAVVLLGTRELASNLEPLTIGLRQAARVGNRLAPLVSAVLAFVSGVVLLWSGATPAIPARLRALEDFMPLFVVETSHVLATIVGLALLVIARGLFRKLNGALVLALVLSVAGCVLSFAKGIDYEEGLLLLLVAVALWLSRRQFYRHTRLIDAPLSAGWLIAVVAALGGSVLLTLFAYKDLEYSHDLWWQFEFGAEAARSLRAILAGATALLALAVVSFLRPARSLIALPDTAAIDEVERIIRAQPDTVAVLALTGDKRLLIAQHDAGFLMYGIRGSSWVAMSDPIGAVAVREDLAWRFREMGDREGGRVAFYQTRPQTLPMYIDMGLLPFKLGEEASVVLDTFSLAGAARKSLRAAHARGGRDGLSLQVVERARLSEYLVEMRTISDNWLELKQTREKQFSIGAFTPGYVSRCDAALVRCHGKLVAFATVMSTDQKKEVSVDLMRHVAAVPGSTMVFLFVELFLHYQRHGYERFNLGMAPLSGLEDHPLGPLWHRFGHLLYNRGERFYNFHGLRQFKEKFDPIWEPRYLVTQGGLNPLIVMADIAALIAGGLSGVVAK